MDAQIVHLHRDAPSKPPPGEPCNRCGVCCAAETCPTGRLLFRRRTGPCPALVLYDGCYACELAVAPERHLPILPRRLRSFAARLFRRWIAAGSGCDSTVEVTATTGNPCFAPLSGEETTQRWNDSDPDSPLTRGLEGVKADSPNPQ